MARKNEKLITSESVGEGHPDKLCDQVSDAVLDEVLRQDSGGRVACETYVTMGLIIVGGEITTNAYVDVINLARNVVKEIGYTDPKYGMSSETCAIINTIHSQSPDIAQGVDRGGAGDQGVMIGYACDETDVYMPLPIMLSHQLVRRCAEVRRKGILGYLGPDCKSQVTVRYQGDEPHEVVSVVLACQHTEDILDKSGEYITEKSKKEIIKYVANPILKKLVTKNTKYYVNETGKFVVGGPQSDTGMTGRKIVVDTYGGVVSHGGGAFSGKDPTKVDRSATYMARYVAKNVVAAGLAKKCMIQLSYVIGRAEPMSVMVDTFHTHRVSEEKILALILDNFDLTPQSIIKKLDLRRPIYRQTAAYGHFGRTEHEFTWERLDMVNTLKKKARRK